MNLRLSKIVLFAQLFLMTSLAHAQSKNYVLKGVVDSDAEPVPFATIGVPSLQIGVSTDINGAFELSGIKLSTVEIKVSSIGFRTQRSNVNFENSDTLFIEIELQRDVLELENLVVTGSR